MSTVTLPAFDGSRPLGYLAALGTLRLLSRSGDARLSWRRQDRAGVLTSSRSTLDEVAADLAAVVQTIPPDGVLPGCPPDFPSPGASVWVPRAELIPVAQDALDRASPEERDEVAGWLAALVSPSSVDGKGRAALTLYLAPAGNTSIRTMLSQALKVIRDDPERHLAASLQRRQRVERVTGEYLDETAYSEAGEPLRGDPAATWLALMALPLLPIRGHYPASAAQRRGRPGYLGVPVGWHYPRPSDAGPELRLPLWGHPLPAEAVTALMEHPALSPEHDDDPATAEVLDELGVHTVTRADRWAPPGGKSAGFLRVVRDV